jgi:ATP-dependent exoDNAse (exonuclease V) alpha subunit
MMLKPIELSGEYQEVLDTLEHTQQSVFITGRAGTGKSTLLNLFRGTTKKKVVVLAPTGVAALNVKGQTIHSFFGFPPRPDFESHITKRKYRKMYLRMEVLIIDEISMVRADILDGIDKFLRINRERNEAFGGVQVAFFGDLFQLPPVVASMVERRKFSTQYESPYFFSAEVINRDFDLEIIELRKIYRQDNRHFIRLLEAIRSNTIDYDDLEDLNERFVPDFKSEDFYITLTSRNKTAQEVNKRELAALEGVSYYFNAKIEGKFDSRLFPTDGTLELKLGAQVMFIRNDIVNRNYVNGTIGIVRSISTEKVIVEIENPDGDLKKIEVDREDWEIQKYRMSDKGVIESEIVGTFNQLPLKLSWAVTIHKSQGKTFNKVIIDMSGGAFEHGQTYVALSRCRTLDGIVLRKKLTPRDVMVDPRIVDYCG